VFVLILNNRANQKYYKTRINHAEEKQIEIDQIKEQMQLKFENLLKDVSRIEREAFNKGYSEAEKKNKLTVQIDPIEHESGSNWWIINNKKIEIGFEYSLYYNNLPLGFKPSRHILKSIKTSEINEENLAKLISSIESIESLKSGAFLINGSIKNVKSGLISKFGKKQ
jgi:hypothetical protein